MSPICRFLICAMVGLSCLVDGDGAVAQTPVSVAVRGTLAIEVGSGEVITFPSAAANIFVAPTCMQPALRVCSFSGLEWAARQSLRWITSDT